MNTVRCAQIKQLEHSRVSELSVEVRKSVIHRYRHLELQGPGLCLHQVSLEYAGSRV